MESNRTLYARLGGEAGLTRIVGDFLDHFFRHDRIQNRLVVRRHDAAFHPELTRHWVAFCQPVHRRAKKGRGTNHALLACGATNQQQRLRYHSRTDGRKPHARRRRAG